MPGSDADITIYDPRGQRTLVDDDLHGVAGYTPYAGFQLAGHVRMTLSRGRVVYEEGVFKGEAGYGAFVSRRPFQAARLARYSSDSLN
jgi:dihydropyrimidinase